MELISKFIAPVYIIGFIVFFFGLVRIKNNYIKFLFQDIDNSYLLKLRFAYAFFWPWILFGFFCWCIKDLLEKWCGGG